MNYTHQYYHLFFNLIVIFILSACDSKQSVNRNFDITEVHKIENIEKINLTLEKSKEIIFEVDTNSRNFSLYPFYYYDSVKQKEYFFNRNEITNGIDIYDFSSKNLIKRIDFDTQGPEGISHVDAFFVKNTDSIFVFNRMSSRISLIDFEGNIARRYKLPENSARNIYTTILSKFFVYENFMVFNYTAFGPPEKLGRTHTAVLYDYEKEKVTRLLPPLIPQQLTKNNYASHQVIPQMSKGIGFTTITRFGALPFVYEYDILKDSVQMHQLKSEKQSTFVKPMDKVEPSRRKFLEKSYLQTFYDPYRKVYYSIYMDDVANTDENNNPNTNEDREMSIIIADESFRYRGEITLEKNKNFRILLVTKGGLLISTAHPKNDNLVEEEMQFDLFKLKKSPK